MDTDLIDSSDRLRRWCRLAENGPLAVDTESDHFHAYNPRVCLIQLATAESTVLVDPLAMDDDEMQPLFELFEDPSVPKVLHAGRNDINEMDRDWGVGIANLFDTRTAARFLGYSKNNLAWLLEELLDVKPAPKRSRYNWATRPISDKALRYAVGDVHHLLRLYHRFSDELKSSGWHAPFHQRCEYVAESVKFQPIDFDPDDWRSIRGVKKLDGTGRATARRLYLWRHRFCEECNRSPVTIFPNRALKKLARHRPDSVGELREMSGIPARLVEEQADDLIAEIKQARGHDAPPKNSPNTDDYRPKPDPQQRRIYNELRRWRNTTADRLDIPGEFIATNAVITDIAADPPTNLDELAQFDAILPWHIDMLGEEILRVIQTSSP